MKKIKRLLKLMLICKLIGHKNDEEPKHNGYKKGFAHTHKATHKTFKTFQHKCTRCNRFNGKKL